ncbi:MAG: hypothetical protein KGS72_19755 [Cyanobacteria bacterium REEB67]|nr:hypothetical protein [Cyanobacteria bacterium REEB67]
MKKLASKLADCGSKMPPSKWSFPPHIFSTRRIAVLLSAGLLAVLLNGLYEYLNPLQRVVILPLALWFMWASWQDSRFLFPVDNDNNGDGDGDGDRKS